MYVFVNCIKYNEVSYYIKKNKTENPFDTYV